MNRVLCLLPLLLVAACAEVQMATPGEDQRGKRFEPPPSDKAALYLYREGMLGAMVPVDVTVQTQSGSLDISLAPETWVRIEGEPGPLEVRCAKDQTAGQRINVAPGETRYVEVSYRMSFSTTGCGVNEVSPLEGQRGVLRGKRAIAGRAPL